MVLVWWLLELLMVRCSVGGVKWLVVVALCRGGVSGGPRGVVMVDVLLQETMGDIMECQLEACVCLLVMCLDMSVVVLLVCNRLTRLVDLIMVVIVCLVYFSPSQLVLVIICLASCLFFALLSRCLVRCCIFIFVSYNDHCW